MCTTESLIIVLILIRSSQLYVITCLFLLPKKATKHSEVAVQSMIENRLLNKCMDKISSWSAFSIQMARSFSGAYENNVVPAILVGLLIVCHPPGAICQAPLVPEPCVEAQPRAPTSLTPSCHLSRLILSPSYSFLQASGREQPRFIDTSEPLMSHIFVGATSGCNSAITLFFFQCETSYFSYFMTFYARYHFGCHHQYGFFFLPFSVCKA